MGRVTGIGGLFFRAADPKGLARWYDETLGISHWSTAVWQQEAGPTVLSPFEADTDYFGDRARQWMLNLRVEDLPGLVETLKAKGITVETREEWNDPEIGSFARIHDPEGNPIELWEPA